MKKIERHRSEKFIHEPLCRWNTRTGQGPRAGETGGGYELPVFSCEDCIVRKAVLGPGTEEFDLAYTFCVDAAGRCFDSADHLFEPDEGEDEDDDFGPDVSLN